MDNVEISKKDFGRFVCALAKKFEVLAPVEEKGVFNFRPVSDASGIKLSGHSYLPLKNLFFKPRDVIFRFSGFKVKVPKSPRKKRVVLGAKRCDLNSIMKQDIMFMDETRDVVYANERERTFLIGYHCNEAFDEYCFCGSMDLRDCFDLMLYEKKDRFIVEVGSEKGGKIVRMFRRFFKPGRLLSPKEKVIRGAGRLKKRDISGVYHHRDWKKGVDLCLSCGACTVLCPSCYCFDLEDTNDISDLRKGERVRIHASCQLKDFTTVAGGHVFRESREDRFKHRIYHQLQYFRERHGTNLCTGCGRCIRHCPTRIDFVKIINGMR
jgi:sulfhydrogenase subunit beta (sulfur reductase)